MRKIFGLLLVMAIVAVALSGCVAKKAVAPAKADETTVNTSNINEEVQDITNQTEQDLQELNELFGDLA